MGAGCPDSRPTRKSQIAYVSLEIVFSVLTKGIAEYGTHTLLNS